MVIMLELEEVTEEWKKKQCEGEVGGATSSVSQLIVAGLRCGDSCSTTAGNDTLGLPGWNSQSDGWGRVFITEHCLYLRVHWTGKLYTKAIES